MQVEIKFNINTYDIDAAGHVNNIVYLRWLEDLRTKLISGICNFNELYEEGLYPVIVSTSINYKRQLKLFEAPIGIMELESINHGILTLKANIKVETGIVAFAEQKCVIMNLKTKKMISGTLLSKIINQN
ncbi:acyl-CoA thioesterase [Melioribacter sp. OK-6-Me]|uniref:acyl-CoA thioesterase n=1 Tax=unclassified Melioribacter TaxID=2627329 RepID=UPI003F5CD664